jgi:hypothetical protein
MFSISSASGQLTNSYSLVLTQDCGPASGTEVGAPYPNVGVKIKPYNPQVGGPQKPHPTAQPNQTSNQNGSIYFSSLSCSTGSFSLHYKIGGVWMDYYSILEVDCTDGQSSYFNTVKLPSDFSIREWLSCDEGTRFLPHGPFAHEAGCEQGLDIHIPNHFFSGTGDDAHEFILDVNRVNRNTGQVSDYATYSFTADDDAAGKLGAANEPYVYLDNCSSGSSTLYISFDEFMEANSGSFECGESIDLDVSLGVRCPTPDKIPVWSLAWVDYTFNTLNSPFQFVFKTRPSVDAQNGAPYQNGDPNDGILLNIDTDPNGSGQGPLLGNASATIQVEVDNSQLDCIESVEVYLYEYESCSAVFDPVNGLVSPGPGLTNPFDITNQFTPTNSFADVIFSTDILGGELNQNTCYYVELVAESVCGSTFETGGRFQTGSCSYCREIVDAPTATQIYPTYLKQGENLNMVFDKATLSEGTIQVHNMKGMLMTEQTISSQTKSYQMNTSNLTPGMYIVNIKVDGLDKFEKIVVQ